MRPNFVGAAQVENPLLNLRLHASRAMARAARTVQQSLHATFTETTYPLVSRGTRDTHGLRCGSGCPAGSHPLHKELPAIWSKARSTIQLRALHVPDLHNPDRARGLSLCQQGPWELHLVPVTPALRWDDAGGMYPLLVFGLAALVLAGLGRLFATRVYLLPLWAIACYLLFFAVVDAAAAILGSSKPSEQPSVSQLVDVDLWMTFIGIPVSIFVLTVLGGIQMMGLTQLGKRMWLFGAAYVIRLVVGL